MMDDYNKKRIEEFKRELMALCAKHHFDIEAKIQQVSKTEVIAILEIVDVTPNDKPSSGNVVN